MTYVRDREQATVEWRPGVVTKLRASRATGATALCVIEQWCAAGAGAPPHVHPNAEEVIVVLAGTAAFVIDGDAAELTAGDTAILRAATPHSFRNVGDDTLHILAAFSAAEPVADYLAGDAHTIGSEGGRRLDAHRAHVLPVREAADA